MRCTEVAMAYYQGVAGFPHPMPVVFDALLRAAPRVGLQVVQSDRDLGHLFARAGVSWLSWGENIWVSLTEVSQGRTRVAIVSTTKFGLVDWGKSRDNVESLLQALSSLLNAGPTTATG
jgi:hypothetical protein